MEEPENNPNYITKAFEDHPIFIFNEQIEPESKKKYYFRANDIGNALDIVNIRSSIQNFEDDEMVVRKVYDQKGAMQNTKFLTSHGVYRLLYSSKKPLAKKFRKWAGDILDDIIFNESNELKKKLAAKDIEIAENMKNLQIAESKNIHLITKIENITMHKVDGYVYLMTSRWLKNNNHFRFGKTINLKSRLSSYQVGRTIEDQMYYVFIFKAKNVLFLELFIRDLLKEYRQDPKKDIYVIQWPILHRFIKITCENFDEVITEKNLLIQGELHVLPDEELKPKQLSIDNFVDNEIDDTEVKVPVKASIPIPKVKTSTVIDTTVSDIITVTDIASVQENIIESQFISNDNKVYKLVVNAELKPCRRCGLTFTSGKLQKHMKEASCEIRFQCNECDRMFYSELDLNEHTSRKVSCVRYRCERCNKGFDRKDMLKDHMERKIPCKII